MYKFEDLFKQTVQEKKSFIFNKNRVIGNIGYGLNNNAARMTGTSITSICENNVNGKFDFYLLCSGINKANIENFGLLAEQYEINIHMFFLDTKSLLLKNLAASTIFPLPAWYRIFFPCILNAEKLLYLDTDIICNGSIDKLFNLPMQNSIIASVADFKRVRIKKTQQLKLKNHIYFNSGVMLINLRQWKNNGITNELLNLIHKNKNLFDQDVLNIVFSKKPHIYLDNTYNNIGLWCEPPNIIKENLHKIKLIHFANHPKPWSVLWQYEKRPYMEDIYSRYENLSPWKGTPLEMPINYHHKRWYAEILRNQGKFKKALYWYWQYLKGKYQKQVNN